MARGLNGFCQMQRDSPDAATDVQAPHPRTQTGTIQQRFSRGPFHGSQKTQPLGRLVAAAKHVIPSACRTHGLAWCGMKPVVDIDLIGILTNVPPARTRQSLGKPGCLPFWGGLSMIEE